MALLVLCINYLVYSIIACIFYIVVPPVVSMLSYPFNFLFCFGEILFIFCIVNDHSIIDYFMDGSIVSFFRLLYFSLKIVLINLFFSALFYFYLFILFKITYGRYLHFPYSFFLSLIFIFLCVLAYFYYVFAKSYGFFTKTPPAFVFFVCFFFVFLKSLLILYPNFEQLFSIGDFLAFDAVTLVSFFVMFSLVQLNP